MSTQKTGLDQGQEHGNIPTEILTPPLKVAIPGLSDIATAISGSSNGGSDNLGILDFSASEDIDLEALKVKEANDAAEAERKRKAEEEGREKRQAFMWKLPAEAQKWLLLRRVSGATAEQVGQWDAALRTLLNPRVIELFRGENWCAIMPAYVADAVKHNGDPEDFRAVQKKLAETPEFFRSASAKAVAPPKGFKSQKFDDIIVTYPASMREAAVTMMISLKELKSITRKREEREQKEQKQQESAAFAKFREGVTIKNLDALFNSGMADGPNGVGILPVKERPWTSKKDGTSGVHPGGMIKYQVDNNLLTVVDAMGDLYDDAMAIRAAAPPLYLDQVIKGWNAPKWWLDFTEDQHKLDQHEKRLLNALAHWFWDALNSWERDRKKASEQEMERTAAQQEATATPEEFVLQQKKSGRVCLELNFFQDPPKTGKTHKDQWISLDFDWEEGAALLVKTAPVHNLFPDACFARFKMGKNFDGAPSMLRGFLRACDVRTRKALDAAKAQKERDQKNKAGHEQLAKEERERVHQAELAADPVKAMYEQPDEDGGGADEQSSAPIEVHEPVQTAAEEAPAPKRKRASKKAAE